MEKWHIIHTRPRWEKKLTDVLEQNGIESYCPVKMRKRQWSDRIKTIAEPVFKGHVFVKIVPEQKTAVRLIEGVINFVYKNRKPALVKEKDIKAFKKLLDTGISIGYSEKVGMAWQTEEDENSKQQKVFQFYLNSFTARLIASADRSKLV